MKYGKIIISRAGVNVATLIGLKTQSLKERLCGLLALNKLKDMQALWIQPCNSVHTAGMNYPIDLIYLDKENKVCAFSEDIKAWRVSGCFKAKVTIELLAGSINKLNVQCGDGVEWQD